MSKIMVEETIKKRDHKNYFPRPMRIVDFNYNEYPDAIYTVDIETFKIETKTITLVASFYKTAEDFDAGNPPISERDGGIRRVTYRGEEFDKFVAAHGAQVAEVTQLLHGVFANLKTVPNSATGEMESFFADAGDVIMPTAMRKK